MPSCFIFFFFFEPVLTARYKTERKRALWGEPNNTHTKNPSRRTSVMYLISAKNEPQRHQMDLQRTSEAAPASSSKARTTPRRPPLLPFFRLNFFHLGGKHLCRGRGPGQKVNYPQLFVRVTVFSMTETAIAICSQRPQRPEAQTC